MRRHVIIGGLLLIGLGVILGATVFRTDIAQATGLAQAVTVSNTPAQAVPVREQNTDSSAGGAIAVHEQGTVKVSVSNNSSDNVPYQHTIDFNPDATICGSNLLVCRVEFPAVPPGKRLILTYASAHYGLIPGGLFPSVEIADSNSSFGSTRIALPAPVREGTAGDTYVAAGPIKLYVEAGKTPTMLVAGQYVSSTNTANASLVGYLVSTT